MHTPIYTLLHVHVESTKNLTHAVLSAMMLFFSLMEIFIQLKNGKVIFPHNINVKYNIRQFGEILFLCFSMIHSIYASLATVML